MAIEVQDPGTALVHWLVVGQFGLHKGKTLSLTRGDFDEALQKANVTVQATIPDRIGAGATRKVSFKIDSLKALTLKSVVASLPELGELLGKAEQVSKLKTPTAEDLAGIIGEGKLLEQLKALIAPEEAPKPAEPAASEGGDIFEKAEAPKKTVKGAIDMFVKGTSSSSRKKGAPSAKQLRDVVEDAAYGIAADVLRSPEVSAIEGAWRGLRLLLTECPKDSSMLVNVVEADPEDVVEVLREREHADGVDEPDAIFVPSEIGSLPRLSELADLAEQDLIPIVVGVPPALFGSESVQDVGAIYEKLESSRMTETPEWKTAWDELRAQEPTRWLCTVLNRVALHSEGAGAAKRTAFGSGVWALAAMLAASFKASASFARVLGKTGSLRAPAAYTIETGTYKDTSVPTEAFFAIEPADRLAQNGILALGSGRNSDAIVLTKVPMVRSAKDAVPLSAQILTGRVVRFANWVKPQLPEGCDSKTANDVYMAAASVFLFPNQTETAHLRAAVTNIEGQAHVVVRAAANPAVAGIPFEIAFPLNLHWSVPAPESAPEPAAAKTAPAEEKKPPAGGLKSASVGFDIGVDKDKG